MLGVPERRDRPQTPGQDPGQSGGVKPSRLDECGGERHTGRSARLANSLKVSPSAAALSVGHETRSESRLQFQDRAVLTVGESRCDRPMACRSFASPSKHSTSAPSRGPSAVASSAGHRWSRFGRSASRRSSASWQASSARRPIAFIARTSILAPRSEREERRSATRWRTHAPCRLPPAGRTRRPCAAAPWVSSRSSSARICFSSALETRLRLTYSPQPGHVPRSPAHEKRQPQKQATSISDCLSRRAVVPADASFGL